MFRDERAMLIGNYIAGIASTDKYNIYCSVRLTGHPWSYMGFLTQAPRGWNLKANRQTDNSKHTRRKDSPGTQPRVAMEMAAAVQSGSLVHALGFLQSRRVLVR